MNQPKTDTEINALDRAKDEWCTHRAHFLFNAAIRIKQAEPSQSLSDCVTAAEDLWTLVNQRVRAAPGTQGN
ncbi:MAG TPA: hypothetical protein VFN25_01115 [Dokdonella sp.]|uniref:hypothetical protein n=1 Tax=Dokdonella sp. TaxID=2291710 RepID=UPI002D7FB29E|nr:hypothetical protein [Dokdonella sp.]HET9031481.1 hypothetical protein [Dokdonella sp.]